MKHKKDKGNNKTDVIIRFAILYVFIAFLIFDGVVDRELPFSVAIGVEIIFTCIVYNGIFKKYRRYVFAYIVGGIVLVILLILMFLSLKYDLFNTIFYWPTHNWE